MEFISYQSVSTNSGSLNTGSYLNDTEIPIFFKENKADLWFGYSANDVIELGIFDRSKNLVGWKTINQEKTFKNSVLTTFNDKNTPVTYSYSELLPSFTLNGNNKILVNPISDVSSSFGISEGSFVISYNFTREMAGSPSSPLVIKEISPSRTELKLVPIFGNNNYYESFCKKEVIIRDISSLYIQKIKECPYGNIFTQVYSLYTSEINTLKRLFFLNSDGEVVIFLKNLYEDFINYSNLSQINGIVPNSERLTRIQGIKTYFINYLLENYETSISFPNLDSHFEEIVNNTIQKRFVQVGKSVDKEYERAKIFIKNFFVDHFYKPISDYLSQTYFEKYFSYLKNALNFGNGKILPILNHSTMDERVSPSDPLTLLVKLQHELPNDISTQSKCWISNISLSPYILNVILRNPVSYKLVKISPPNFNAKSLEVSVGNVNKSYSKEDLTFDSDIERELTISRKLEDLNVDYTDFKNFVIFSSAELRLKVFKNKIIQLNSLSSSISTLSTNNTTFLNASGSNYPFYENELESFQEEMDGVINRFDGYESYLYRKGIYKYSGGTFISSSYINNLELSASYYDKNNRDSFINNTPEHVLLDSENDEYIVFLSMIGHFFDDIYVYIASLPSEKKIGNKENEEFTRKIADEMLKTFGWNVDDNLDQSNLVNNYLTSEQSTGLSEMSSETRLKSIRNRILVNLPRILKTKGTEESVRMLLSCYGIPNSLLNIREYGGVSYEEQSSSYTQYEKSYLYNFHSSSIDNRLQLSSCPNTKTIMFKFSMDKSSDYPIGSDINIIGEVPSGVLSSSTSGSGNWSVGFSRDRDGKNGKLFFRLGYKGYEKCKIYTPKFPIFNGEIYSVMLRKNNPDENFEYTTTTVNVPTKYDLIVRKNENGRNIISASGSAVVYDPSGNEMFNSGNSLMVGGWFYSSNSNIPLNLVFDKLQVWSDVISDKNFEDYTNYINSYSYSGSYDASKTLLFRMHVEYPFNLNQISSGSNLNGEAGITTISKTSGFIQNSNPYYASGSEEKLSSYYGDLGFSSIDRIICVGTPTGSLSPVYNTSSCSWVSQSAFPYQFKEVEYPCTYTIPKYGPNKFRNEKVKYVDQSYEVRFDKDTRSTFVDRGSVSPDSNKIGFFADTQDFKNKDIIRYFGNFDFMEIIGDPTNVNSSSYSSLRSLRKQYVDSKNEFSGSKTLYNELITLYKIYFNQSIFETIKNLVPARTNPIVGVLVEPSILERPKYESKVISTELNTGSAYFFDITASHYFRDPNTKLTRLTQSLEFGEFGIDLNQIDSTFFNTSSLPSNLTSGIDISYINFPSFTFTNNFTQNGVICDTPDKFQLGHVGSSGVMKMGKNTTGEIPFDQIRDTHGIIGKSYYLLKRWTKHSIYSKSGSWNRNEVKSDNLYNSASIYLYDYVVVSNSCFEDMVYTENTSSRNTIDPYGRPTFGNLKTNDHDANTFKNTPNSKFNNTRSTLIWNGLRNVSEAPFFDVESDTYFEITEGYPRNHLTHKRELFSLYKTRIITSPAIKRNSQSITTTIGIDGLEDGSSPIQYIDVGNVIVVQGDNVINH